MPRRASTPTACTSSSREPWPSPPGTRFSTELGPNDFFGEIAVFEGATRSANVVNRGEEVSLLRLGRDDLLSLMEELPAIAICICQTLSRRVRDLTERVTV